MKSLILGLKNEILRVIPAIIFFIITFNLINLTERLMIHSTVPPLESYLTATIGALLVGKILIIVNSLGFINAFPEKPLIYNITWKFIIYGIFVLLFRILEEIIYYWLHYEGPLSFTPFIEMRLSSPKFWAIEVWLLMLFFVYVTAAEFVRKLSKETINEMLFGK